VRELAVYSLFISLPFWEPETQSPVGVLLQDSTVVNGGTEVIGAQILSVFQVLGGFAD